MDIELVCALPECKHGAAEGSIFCSGHEEIYRRPMPDRLEKLDTDNLSRDQMEWLRLQITRDAMPLVAVAMAHISMKALGQ